MICVDTNVLLWLFLSDDPRQHAAARAFFDARSREDAAFVSVVTTVEFVWVLRRVYGKSQDEALGLLLRVLGSEDVVVETLERVRLALDMALETGADFADLLIALAAEFAGCDKTMTFDRDAAKLIPGMELLA